MFAERSEDTSLAHLQSFDLGAFHTFSVRRLEYDVRQNDSLLDSTDIWPTRRPAHTLFFPPGSAEWRGEEWTVRRRLAQWLLTAYLPLLLLSTLALISLFWGDQGAQLAITALATAAALALLLSLRRHTASASDGILFATSVLLALALFLSLAEREKAKRQRQRREQMNLHSNGGATTEEAESPLLRRKKRLPSSSSSSCPRSPKALRRLVTSPPTVFPRAKRALVSAFAAAHGFFWLACLARRVAKS